jgi:hypothetical protein
LDGRHTRLTGRANWLLAEAKREPIGTNTEFGHILDMMDRFFNDFNVWICPASAYPDNPLVDRPASDDAGAAKPSIRQSEVTRIFRVALIFPHAAGGTVL